MQGGGGGSAGGREAAAAWTDHAQEATASCGAGLYTLYQAGSSTTGTLLPRAAPGVRACGLTFG